MFRPELPIPVAGIVKLDTKKLLGYLCEQLPIPAGTVKLDSKESTEQHRPHKAPAPNCGHTEVQKRYWQYLGFVDKICNFARKAVYRSVPSCLL